MLNVIYLFTVLPKFEITLTVLGYHVPGPPDEEDNNPLPIDVDVK